MLSTELSDLNWINYIMSWAIIKKVSVEEAAADPECKAAFEIWQKPTPILSVAVEPEPALSVAEEPTVEPVLSVAVEPPKKRAYKRKTKVVVDATVECVAEEPTVECVAEEPTVECVVEEPTLSVAEEPPAPVVAVKTPKPRVTRKVLRL